MYELTENRGWDWGPILTPCGPWRPVRLEIFRTRVTDFRVDYSLSDRLDAVSGSIEAFSEGSPDAVVRFTIHKDEKLLFQEDQAIKSDGSTQIKFSLETPSLWYPHGYGGQSLYIFSAYILSALKDPFTVTKKIGFRKTELVQRLDELGKSFYFKVNDREIFCGGSNWIPADCFVPRISPERYRKWIEIARDGNQIMARYVEIG
jgi:beta-mannosidase